MNLTITGKNIRVQVVLIVLLLVAGMQVMAQDEEQKALLKRINDVKASPELKAKAIYLYLV